ncbi:hypothetical protein VTN77DRAFT_5895 [Rasamsonia byssochlamydoides]|uniref:uncharacterized protein n=1 Tax=Rasamsonia byssochlamydoides TaxID=89139 RepID=UPI003741F65D
MDIPKPEEGDVNIGTDTFRACWALTAVVGLVLTFRLGMKAWVRWSLPQVSAPERVWGLEDFIFLFAYSVDVAHMVLIELSYHWGLGRHFFYLTPEERIQALRYDFASQPAAVAAAMISRTGMMWFLYQCFANSNWRLRMSIVVCMIIQIVVNSITIVQIVVQCGPNPYRPTDRTKYFHYMWDPLPADGSVKCQSPSVQTTVGFVQGGFNTVIDLSLAVLASFELWQFFLQTLDRNPGVSAWTQFRKMNSSVRSRRIWQTITLGGPLVLSGVASIVKTYLLKSLGDRSDFTYNIVSFVLWVKIENYSILIATCAPVIRLFMRTFVDQRRESRYPGYPWSRSHSSNTSPGQEMKRRKSSTTGTERTGTTGTERAASSPNQDFLTSVPGSKSDHEGSNWSSQFPSCSEAPAALPPSANSNVTVKTDIVVEVDDP